MCQENKIKLKKVKSLIAKVAPNHRLLDFQISLSGKRLFFGMCTVHLHATCKDMFGPTILGKV